MGNDKPEVRNLVTYRDSHGEEHQAFITAVHSDEERPLVNVAFVATDMKKIDAYGRELLRATSIRHARERTPTGICWRWPYEELGPEPEPAPRHVRR